MKGILILLSLLYQAGCQFKNVLYSLKIFRPKNAPLPVISIGNITFGGSEKTPLVMFLIGELLQNGCKPALVTRGYRGNWERKGGMLSSGNGLLGSWEDSGEEAFMVARNFPKAGVFIGKERLKSCRNAHLNGYELAVCDDGFQHRRLFRDVDIVLYDPAERNPLREPVSSLRRAHFLLLKQPIGKETRCSFFARFPRLNVFAYSVITEGFFYIDGTAQQDVESLRRKKILAFCGIARPLRFLGQLAAEGIRPCTLLKFPDHHLYPPASIKRIRAKLQSEGAEALVTTEKDAVKIAGMEPFREIPTFYLKISVRTEEGFSSQIISLLQNKARDLPKGTAKV